MISANSRIGGFTLIEMLLCLIILSIATAAAIPIVNSITNYSKLNETKARINYIVYQMKSYYASHQALPDPPQNTNKIPVDTLGIEPKYALDSWGQYFYYYKGTGVSKVNVLNTTRNAGVIISYGPNQKSDFSRSLNDITASSSDDLIVPINVYQEALDISRTSLKILTAKAWYNQINGLHPDISDLDNCLAGPFSTSCPNFPFATEAFLRTDPWGQTYQWGGTTLTNPSTDPRYHKFFSTGPDTQTYLGDPSDQTPESQKAVDDIYP